MNVDHDVKKKNKQGMKDFWPETIMTAWSNKKKKIFLKGINQGGDRGQNGKVWLWEVKPC